MTEVWENNTVLSGVRMKMKTKVKKSILKKLDLVSSCWNHHHTFCVLHKKTELGSFTAYLHIFCCWTCCNRFASCERLANTSLTKIKMQWMQIRLQLIIIFIMIWFDDISIFIYFFYILYFYSYTAVCCCREQSRPHIAVWRSSLHLHPTAWRIWPLSIVVATCALSDYSFFFSLSPASGWLGAVCAPHGSHLQVVLCIWLD